MVHNGIDTEQYAPDHGTDVLDRLGIDPDRPSVVYVGRITRQKGLPYLLRAARSLPAAAQLVLLAGAPDTPEIARRGRGPGRGARAPSARRRVWVPRDAAQARGHPGAHARVGVRLPVDLRADGHREPGGDGLRDAGRRDRDRRHPGGGRGRRDRPARADRAGSRRHGDPVDPDRFVADLAAAITERCCADPDRAERWAGPAGPRAIEHFSWAAIADHTMEVYRSVLPEATTSGKWPRPNPEATTSGNQWPRPAPEATTSGNQWPRPAPHGTTCRKRWPRSSPRRWCGSSRSAAWRSPRRW